MEACNPYYDLVPQVVLGKYAQGGNRSPAANMASLITLAVPRPSALSSAWVHPVKCWRKWSIICTSRAKSRSGQGSRLFRPFSLNRASFPGHSFHCQIHRRSLDRTGERGAALGEPLYKDVCTAFYEWPGPRKKPVIDRRRHLRPGFQVDFTPGMAKAVFDNLKSMQPKIIFPWALTTMLPTSPWKSVQKYRHLGSPQPRQCIFWGFGSDGTVGANKQAVKIIGDHTDLMPRPILRLRFRKKSGGLTQSYLRFAARNQPHSPT